MTKRRVIYKEQEYEEVLPDEKIKEGAIHQLQGGYYFPLFNPNSIGKTPKEFSSDRKFFNPIKLFFIL